MKVKSIVSKNQGKLRWTNIILFSIMLNIFVSSLIMGKANSYGYTINKIKVILYLQIVSFIASYLAYVSFIKVFEILIGRLNKDKSFSSMPLNSYMIPISVCSIFLILLTIIMPTKYLTITSFSILVLTCILLVAYHYYLLRKLKQLSALYSFLIPFTSLIVSIIIVFVIVLPLSGLVLDIYQIITIYGDLRSGKWGIG